MKNFKAAFSVLFLGVLMFAFNSCSEDNPVIERVMTEGPTENGSIEIFVKDGIGSTYWGNVPVKIFQSTDDRDNDNHMNIQYTDEMDPEYPDGIGAIFPDLEFQKYYFKCSFEHEGKLYAGVAEGFALKGATSEIILNVYQ